MKKLSDIVGLRIVTIEDGIEEGIIRSAVINPQKGKVDYFATEKGVSILKAKVVDSQTIEGIGDYAVTTKNKDNVMDISLVSEALELVHNGAEIIGNRIISKKGNLIGEVIDLFIDEEDNFVISSIQIITNTSNPTVYNIPADNVITYGQNFLVIAKEYIMTEDLPVEKEDVTVRNVSDLFDFKQKQYLNGKKCLKNILSKNGKIIVKKGQVINDSVYDLVKANGKIFELIKGIG